MTPEQAVQAAARCGLDAVCLTDHHLMWSRDELDRLTDLAGIPVFGGTEITTEQGDVLVFGLSSPLWYGVSVTELSRRTQAEGGLMIAAHPFRGSMFFGQDVDAREVQRAASRDLYRHVDAVEIWNGCDSIAENNAAAQLASDLGLPGVAGSDAHRLEQVGVCYTVFERTINNERELIEALRRDSVSIEVAPFGAIASKFGV
jgi:predicted metal-dependent phosphoesterase TrpH